MQRRISSSLRYLFQDVIRTIVQSGGIKHLVTMATSEHVIMQNEALVALALIAALELGEYPNSSLHLIPSQSVPKRSHWGRKHCAIASSFPLHFSISMVVRADTSKPSRYAGNWRVLLHHSDRWWCDLERTSSLTFRFAVKPRKQTYLRLETNDLTLFLHWTDSLLLTDLIKVKHPLT